MTIEKFIPAQTTFEELEIGDCFMLNSYNPNASVFLKVDSNNSRINTVNLTTNMLIEASSSVIVFPVKATLTVELEE